ncbi:MAG: hypothetical protein IJ575_11505 [Selenomonadaceae bacterium]|nr:hypothetical protein [Selenomonadaceae bacterium]
MLQKIQKFVSEKGQGIVEYAMVLGFVALLAVGLWQSGLYGESKKIFGTIASNVSSTNESVKNINSSHLN